MKFLKILSVILLIIFPFSTILSNFSPYWTTHTFNDFLIASFVLAIVSWLLGWFIAPQGFNKTGILFFLLGAVVGPPLMLGPPEESAKLLERVTEEHFRYGMLMLATFLYAGGFIVILKQLFGKISNIHKIILLPFAIAVVLMIWDNYSSYHLNHEMTKWINSGNDGNDFSAQYEYHSFLRTLGRTLVSLTTLWVSWLLVQTASIRKWTAIVLSIFCSIGIVSFFLFNFVSPAFYFPMMVPAFALAPAYWLGISLISRNH